MVNKALCLKLCPSNNGTLSGFGYKLRAAVAVMLGANVST